MKRKQNNKKYLITVVCLLMITLENNAQINDATEIFRNAQNSVVKIYGMIIDDIGIKQGSGVVIKDKIIATNYHNFDQCDSLYIQHYNKKYDITDIIYADPNKDILIIKVKKLDLKPLSINSEKILIGEKVYALGSPEGYENTITDGIISGIRDSNKVLQITAGITHGSSGGAVLNKRGELIGISFAGMEATNININFAIPIEYFIDSTDWCNESDNNCMDKLKQKYTTYNLLTHTFNLLEIYYSNNNMGMVFTQLKKVFNYDAKNRQAKELVYYMLKNFSLKSLGKENLNTLKPYMPDGYAIILEGLNIIENKNDYYNAITLFIDAVNKEPNNKDYYYFLGIAYEKQGYYDYALKCMLEGARNGDKLAEKWLLDYGYKK